MSNSISVTIAKREFKLAQPYQDGSVINEDEARALNALRRENICNNLRSRVASWEGTEEELDAYVADYDANYTFGSRETGKRDPILLEARSLAKDSIKAQLRAKGMAIPDTSELNKAVDKLMDDPSAGAQLRELAKERISQRRAAASAALQALSAMPA